jgi:hypothetical protein
MSTDSSPKTTQDSKAGAGAAGVGGGTLLVLLANNLPPQDAKLKTCLLLAAPSLSIFLGGVWLWLQLRIANYLQDREALAIIDSAKVTLEQALKNTNTSEDHRAKLRTQLETLELIAVERQMDRIKALHVVTEKDP